MNLCHLQRNIKIEGETASWNISAKFFADKREFRIYELRGDINKLDELVAYIRLFLNTHDIFEPFKIVLTV